MGSASIPGFNANLYVDIAAVPTKIAELREATLSVDHDVIDATTHDSAPWKENIEGLRGFTISGEALYVTGDAGQEEVIDRILDGATVDFELRPKEGSGLRVWTGTARITSWEQSMPNDDANAVDIEMEGCGALVDATQA